MSDHPMDADSSAPRTTPETPTTLSFLGCDVPLDHPAHTSEVKTAYCIADLPEHLRATFAPGEDLDCRYLSWSLKGTRGEPGRTTLENLLARFDDALRQAWATNASQTAQLETAAAELSNAHRDVAHAQDVARAQATARETAERLASTAQEIVKSVSGGSASTPIRRRLDNPPVFSGDETDPTLRQELYTNLRSKARHVLAADSALFRSASDRILWLGTLFKGPAYTRLRSMLDLVAADPVADSWTSGAMTWRDTDDVFEFLDLTYIVQDVIATARLSFHALTQGNRIFADFISDFVRLADACDYPPLHRVESLREKVSTRLKNNLVSVIDRPASDDFPGWMGLFRQLTNNLADLDCRKAHAPTSTPRRNDPSGSGPMDLDVVSTRRPPLLRTNGNAAATTSSASTAAALATSPRLAGTGRKKPNSWPQSRSGVSSPPSRLRVPR